MALPGVAAAQTTQAEAAAEPVHFTAMLSPTSGGSDQEVAFGAGGVRCRRKLAATASPAGQR